jgi:hypothetical protein
MMLLSCDKSGSLNNATDYNYHLKSNSNYDVFDLTQLSSEIENYYTCAIGNYTLQIVCSCEYSDLLIEDIWKDCQPSFKIFNFDIELDLVDWDNIVDYYRKSCVEDEIEEIISDTISLLNEQPFVSNEEVALFENLFASLLNDNFYIEDARSLWSNLKSSSRLQNDFSLIVIETMSSLIDFNNNNPIVFNFVTSLDDDDDVVSPLIHKVVSVVGGEVLADIGEDMLDNYKTENYQYTTGRQICRSLIKSAIVGSLF